GGTNVRIHPPVRVEEGVVLEEVELGPNVTVGAGTTLRRCAVRDSIIGAGATIEDARLHDSLIGDRVVIRGVNGSVSVCDDSVGSAWPRPEGVGICGVPRAAGR